MEFQLIPFCKSQSQSNMIFFSLQVPKWSAIKEYPPSLRGADVLEALREVVWISWRGKITNQQYNKKGDRSLPRINYGISWNSLFSLPLRYDYQSSVYHHPNVNGKYTPYMIRGKTRYVLWFIWCFVSFLKKYFRHYCHLSDKYLVVRKINCNFAPLKLAHATL